MISFYYFYWQIIVYSYETECNVVFYVYIAGRLNQVNQHIQLVNFTIILWWKYWKFWNTDLGNREEKWEADGREEGGKEMIK